MTWQTGTVIKSRYGQYTIVQKLGQGGFGITYLAKDRQQNLVVIKTIHETNIPAHLLQHFREDFYNEALRLAEVKAHNHIVKVIEIIHHENSPCIIMEYVAGQTLENWINSQKRLESEILVYIQQIGQALQYVHEKKYLHRDIKPQNILIRETETEAVLIDFGIARSFDPNRSNSMTKFSSAGYTPIEQVSSGLGKSGQYSDVYGLAATLYYCLTQITPPKAEDRVLKITHRQSDPLIDPQQLNADISDPVKKAILKGMAVYPKYRSPTIPDWLDLLGKVFPAPTVTSANPSPSQQVRIKSSKKLILGGGIAGLIGLLGLFGLFSYHPDRSRVTDYSQDGLSFRYPMDWQKTNFEANSFDPTIARFIPPDSSVNESSDTAITVGIQPLPNPLPIEKALREKTREIQSNLPEAILVSNRQITLDNRPAYELIYQGKENGRSIQKKQIGIIQDNKLYTITYEADVNQYTKYEKEAQTIIDSVNLTP